jgi:hypothetical protein
MKKRKREQKSKRNHFDGIRVPMPPGGYRHTDRKKKANKKACRVKVDW